MTQHLCERVCNRPVVVAVAMFMVVIAASAARQFYSTLKWPFAVIAVVCAISFVLCVLRLRQLNIEWLRRHQEEQERLVAVTIHTLALQDSEQ